MKAPKVLALAAALLVGFCACALGSSGRSPPNDVRNCDVGGSSSSSTSSTSSSDDSPCPVISPGDCASGEVMPCGGCQACVVYLGRGEQCSFPWTSNARCDPSLVCYTRGTCGDLVV